MHKIAKFLVPILKDLNSNEYNVKDSFDFAKKILQQNSDCFMASLGKLHYLLTFLWMKP